ncbi:hypothetical protein ACWCQK_22705 [Streptomyces sp. NPDC002306]
MVGGGEGRGQRGDLTVDFGGLTVDPLVVPLSDVERAWNLPVPPGRRVVLTP